MSGPLTPEQQAQVQKTLIGMAEAIGFSRGFLAQLEARVMSLEEDVKGLQAKAEGRTYKKRKVVPMEGF